MKTSMGIAALALVIAASLVSAGCGGAGQAAVSSETGSETGSETAPPSGTVAVELYEWGIKVGGQAVDLSGTVALQSGQVTFSVKNTGTMVHAFEIKGNGIDAKTNDMNPGATATLNVTLSPGSYTVWCPVDGHKDAGMDGSVTVK